MTEAAKKCCTCHRLLPLAAFNVRRAAKDGRQARCRECSAQWYVRNRDAHRANVAARNAEVVRRNREKLIEYLLGHPCVDCGESDVRVLDFDHRDPSQKKDTVTKLSRWALNWDRVLEEIAKCDVRCANCHRKRTAVSSGWERHRVQLEQEAAMRRAATARLSLAVASPRHSR